MLPRGLTSGVFFALEAFRTGAHGGAAMVVAAVGMGLLTPSLRRD